MPTHWPRHDGRLQISLGSLTWTKRKERPTATTRKRILSLILSPINSVTKWVKDWNFWKLRHSSHWSLMARRTMRLWNRRSCPSVVQRPTGWQWISSLLSLWRRLMLLAYTMHWIHCLQLWNVLDLKSLVWSSTPNIKCEIDSRTLFSRQTLTYPFPVRCRQRCIHPFRVNLQLITLLITGHLSSWTTRARQIIIKDPPFPMSVFLWTFTTSLSLILHLRSHDNWLSNRTFILSFVLMIWKYTKHWTFHHQSHRKECFVN